MRNGGDVIKFALSDVRPSATNTFGDFEELGKENIRRDGGFLGMGEAYEVLAR